VIKYKNSLIINKIRGRSATEKDKSGIEILNLRKEKLALNFTEINIVRNCKKY